MFFKQLEAAKKQGIYFKIQGTYFKIYALYFLPFQTSDSQQLTKTSKFALNSTVSVIYKKARTFPSAFPLSKELLTLQSIRNEQINARFRHHKKNTPGTV